MTDMKKPQGIASLIMLLIFLVVIQTQVKDANAAKVTSVQTAPSTVSTDTWAVTTLEAFQRKTFFAHNRFWVFCPEGPDTNCKTSTDGVTWGPPTFVCSGGPYAGRFSLWFDGEYIHYVRSTSIPSESIMYRRGKPYPDGTIIWSTPEQTVIAVSDIRIYEPFIAVDSEGYPWIGYRWGTDGDRYPNCTKSSSNNGTWQTATGFPYGLSSLSAGNWAVSIVPLTQGKVYAVYLCKGALRGKFWNGTAFETEELIATASIDARTRFAHSVVAREDDVYLAFLNSTVTDNHILFLTRTSGTGWSEQEIIQTSVGSTAFPVISIDLLDSELYCFWADNNTIYYKEYVEGSWDFDATTWFTESDLREDSLSCFYQAWKSRIGVIWNTGKNYQYDVRFFSLATGDITPPLIENVYQLPAEDAVYPNNEVDVNANVTDDTSGVRQVVLNYTIDNNESFTVNMTNLSGNLYNATIPGFPYCTNVTYMITAEDHANNTITTKEMGYEYQYHIVIEFPSPLALPLLMTTMLIALVMNRKKCKHTAC